MSELRKFEGVWIPKNIWLSKDLTLQEKVFIVEINSLDNDEGCFASNQYFADFFGISKRRVSDVIKSLIEKKYIISTIIYKKNSKQIDKRVLNVCSLAYGRSIHEPIEESFHTPHEENCTDNNTIDNSKLNNITKKAKLKKEKENINNFFETVWGQYPRKRGKSAVNFTKKKELYNFGLDAITKAIDAYKDEIKGKEEQFVLNGSTFFGGRYKDFIVSLDAEKECEEKPKAEEEDY